eukprot:362239-Chlamydomonas_euryale.AAC.3
MHASSPCETLPPPSRDPALRLRCATQAALLDSLYGTERGLSARSEVRAEINELISQMESMSPVPNPTEVRCFLGGVKGLAVRFLCEGRAG